MISNGNDSIMEMDHSTTVNRISINQSIHIAVDKRNLSNYPLEAADLISPLHHMSPQPLHSQDSVHETLVAQGMKLPPQSANK